MGGEWATNKQANTNIISFQALISTMRKVERSKGIESEGVSDDGEESTLRRCDHSEGAGR